MTDLTKPERLRQLEEQVVELTLINQELVQSLALLVGNLERVPEFGRQDCFHLSANHIDERLQEVLRTSLGHDLQSSGISFESETPVPKDLAPLVQETSRIGNTI